MKAAIKNKKVKQNDSYWRGVQSGVDSVIVMLAYVLARRGEEGSEIQKVIDGILDVSDSIEKGYCNHKDLEEVLWDEYRIRVRKRKEWLQKGLEE